MPWRGEIAFSDEALAFRAQGQFGWRQCFANQADAAGPRAGAVVAGLPDLAGGRVARCALRRRPACSLPGSGGHRKSARGRRR